MKDIEIFQREVFKLRDQMDQLLQAQEVSNLWALINSNRPEITEEIKQTALNRVMRLMGIAHQNDYSQSMVESLPSDVLDSPSSRAF